MPRIPTTYKRGRRKLIVTLGDSLTHSYSLTCAPHENWPELMGNKLRDTYSCAVRIQNAAYSGNTSTQFLQRVRECFAFGTPSIVIVGTGGNDPGSGINAATTQANFEAIALFLQNGCEDQVAGQASLPARTAEGTRYLVTSDTSTSGGVATPSGANPGPSTVGGTVTGPQVWYCRNGLAGESGWSRVASLTGSNQVVSRIVFWAPHFLNWSSTDVADASGDGHNGQNATYKAVHTAVLAAKNARGVVYFDAYTYWQQFILDGKESQNSGSALIDGNNQHLTFTGHDRIANGQVATIVAQPGWLAALRAA